MSIKIYKASAGSGKTYTLVYEYIRYMFAMLSLKDINNRVYERQLNFHRRILAVTFTNKATAEMKERIVKGLYVLSQKDFGRNDYVNRLRVDLPQYAGVDDDVVAAIAMCFLKDILQDYTMFRVSTIDGFFQQIVRSFAKELNLNNQYQVELETDKIFELAVDNMLASLSDSDKKMLLGWVTEFATEEIENEKSWNPRRSILSLAKLIQKEMYVSLYSKFDLDINVLTNYKRHLYGIIRKFESELKSVCDRAQGLLDTVPDGIFNKNKVSYFSYDYLKRMDYKVSNTFLGQRDKAMLEDWVTAKGKKEVGLQSIVDVLCPCVNRILDCVDRQGEEFRRYQTAKLVLANLYILGILKEIEGQVAHICRERDCLMISSTTELISKIIDNSDAPFIFEKVGVSTDNFMIDEFQDTSRMQWNNFVPLLDETLSRGEESMIVGDVKQSIYRWRNGDWTILHKDVEERFRRKVEFAPPLDKNFRSGQYVIEFNNMLFDVGDGENGQEKLSLPYWFDCELGKRQINSEFRSIYSGSKQIVGKSKNPKGYVRAEFFEKNDEFTCQEQSLNRMVEEMLRLGHYGEMAVLVRKNTEAAIVAERLQQEGIPFYSTEALCVAENIAVRFIVAVLYFLMQPTEHLYRANLLALYCELFFKRDINADDFELLSYKGEDYEDWMRRLVGDDEKVGRFVQIKNLSLLSLIDGIIDIFDLNGIDDGVYAIYIQSFMDRVRKFAIDGMLDIRSLLEYWGQCGEKAFISMPEGGNAVRIMTIHTSKGLEFGIVFIPFMNWVFGIAKLDHIELAQTIEKRSDGHIFDENVPVVPINYINSRLLLNSFFDVDIKEEFLATCLDTMNVLYVSTTRASQQLYIHCYEPSGNYSKEDSAIRPIFAVTALRAVLMDGDNEKSVFELGDSSDYEQKEKEGEDEEVENVELWCGSCQKDDSQGDKERISWRFTYSEDNKLKQDGVLMHRLFQQIVVVEDVDRAIESFLHDGEIVESEVEKFRKQINSVLSIEGVVDFFDSKWQVWNEATIFDVEKREECRPDRIMLDDELKQAVVLDYKFGYVEKESYKSQVEGYVKLLTKMGYATQGYILYAKKRKLVKI